MNRTALPSLAKQHDIAIAPGNCRAHQYIALLEVQRTQTHTALTGEIRKSGFLNRAVGRCHEDIVAFCVLLYRQDRCHPFTFFQRQQIDHGPTPGIATRQWNMKDFKPIHFPQVRKTQNCGVGTGDQQVLDKVLFLDRGRGLARTTPALRLVVTQRLGFLHTRHGR